ncbi:SDR family NAD(P)-dependent oxidoreductase [Azospirillum agricola]|uniref:SDR family NAD(P)-dependent oxidoreductase n=1 Tax=Azospirillum agricola TaxID=1720247 RepID=UPI000A0F12A4|nr:SDR family NAD(P)-dependent oxidoreductase [Azospirillum agricola]SMH62785.1 NAD(P)-dependent dehydrogenase, short-chain alcohol dehydrogenase family [Azospirillum lipoferum]
MRFKDRVVIVTGAASGIGRATARRLAGEGAALVLVDRDAAALEAVLAELPDGTTTQLHGMDIADESAVETCVAAALQHFGRIDVLCNNAGIACGQALATDQDMAEWQQVIAVNLFGVVHFTKHTARPMRDAGRGAIVNTASVAGIRSGAGGNAYSASKAAVINFTQTAACDLAQWGIRVNAVCPGLIETGMTRRVFDHARAIGKAERLGSRCELRRAGQSGEVAAAIAFLASDDASYITGQAIPVDGGNTASLNLPGMKV